MRTALFYGLMSIAVTQADFEQAWFTFFWVIFIGCILMDVVEFWRKNFKKET